MSILTMNTETREALKRMKELAFAFGDVFPYHLCEQVEEFTQSLLESEKEMKPYTGRSPQRALRDRMVAYMMKVAEEERLATATVFSGIYLFERFLDVHQISEMQLHLVAVTCLIIAGKLEEKDAKTPKIKKLKAYLPEKSEFSYKLFGMVERFVLRYFDFRIIIPTEVNFLDLFMLFALDGSNVVEHGSEGGKACDDNNNNNSNNNNMNILDNNNNIKVNNKNKKAGKKNSKKKAIPGRAKSVNSISPLKSLSPGSRPKFNKHTVYNMHDYALGVLQSLKKYEPPIFYPPSLITAAALLFVRREFGLNFWTERLSAVTTYSFGEVCKCLQHYVEGVLYPRCLAERPDFPDPSYVCSDHTISLYHEMITD